jgi:hypothetical protein
MCAGHRAAELQPHDGSELLGSSCSRARRRYAIASLYATRRAVFVSVGNVVRRRAVTSRAPDF